MLSPLYPIRDLRLSGHAIYIGRSSMEIAVKMEVIEKDGEEQMIMLGELLLSLLINFSAHNNLPRSILNGVPRCSNP